MRQGPGPTSPTGTTPRDAAGHPAHPPAPPGAAAGPHADGGHPRRSLLATGRSGALYFGVVGLLNVAAWAILLLWVGPAHPALVGLGVLAYVFGLRHAFDADHIAAIDNTVRKLLQDGERRPVGAGFYFSLGHATVVALLVLVFSISAVAVRTHLPALQHLGGFIGALVSGAFLYAIGLINLAVLLDLLGVLRRMRHTTPDPAELDRQLQRRGLMTRLLGTRWALVRREWHMYPVGLLFGLGFDTASEVALLAMSAAAASQQMPLIAVMVLPLLFAAGMSLMDTADGAFMATAYTWAFSSPMRKVYYNLTVTALSVFVALAVGTVEFGQVVAVQLHLGGPFWDALRQLSFQDLGISIVGLFGLTWAVSYVLWTRRLQRRWSGGVAASGGGRANG